MSSTDGTESSQEAGRVVPPPYIPPAISDDPSTWPAPTGEPLLNMPPPVGNPVAHLSPPVEYFSQAQPPPYVAPTQTPAVPPPYISSPPFVAPAPAPVVPPSIAHREPGAPLFGNKTAEQRQADREESQRKAHDRAVIYSSGIPSPDSKLGPLAKFRWRHYFINIKNAQRNLFDGRYDVAQQSLHRAVGYRWGRTVKNEFAQIVKTHPTNPASVIQFLSERPPRFVVDTKEVQNENALISGLLEERSDSFVQVTRAPLIRRRRPATEPESAVVFSPPPPRPAPPILFGNPRDPNSPHPSQPGPRVDPQFGAPAPDTGRGLPGPQQGG